MKKVTLMLTALVLVLGISQCKKQENPMPTGEKQRIELTADNGNDGSKVSGSFSAATMNLFWEEGDVITVSGGATGMLTLDSGAGTSQGHFSGEVTLDSRADLVFTWTKLEGEPDFNNQTGTEEWITDNLVLEAKAAYNESGKYNLKMEMPYAVLKLDLSVLVGESGNDVKINVGSNLVAMVTSLAKSASEEVFVAIPANIKRLYTFRGNDETIIKTWELKANTFYTAGVDGAPVVISYPVGAIKGVFTVADPDGTDSGDETKVYFSKGNLQYIGSDATPYWKFAEHQYDKLGKTTHQNSDATDVDRDLFGWGTSGYNGKFPYMTSTTNSDYGDGDNSISGTNYDWGVYNAISNGGDKAGIWRTLTGGTGEWEYLLAQRTMTNGKPRYTYKSTVEGTAYKGLFIYPDDYDGEEVGTAGGPDTWDEIDALGIVYLPAADSRTGINVSNAGSEGYYWATTKGNDSDKAFHLLFYSNVGNDYVLPSSSRNRSYGYSVRLVSEN